MKKKFMLIIMLLLSTMLISCSKSALVDLKGEEILSQNEGRYYIFFHRDDCAGCEMVMPTVLSYIDITTNNERYQDRRKIYGVNLSDKVNEELYRLYKGEGGQGPTGKDQDNYVNGVTDWTKLYIGHTPMLVSVTNGRASYVAQGNVDIETALRRQLGDYS